MKRTVRTTLVLAVPLAFAAGCASNSTQQARFDDSVVATTELSPTSSRPDARVYVDQPAPQGIIEHLQAPPGANPQDWALAEAVRGRLTVEKDRARYPSKIIVTVPKDSNGLVRLSGYVPSKRERQRVEQVVSQVAGVRQVDNELRIGEPKAPNQADATAVGGSDF